VPGKAQAPETDTRAALGILLLAALCVVAGLTWLLTFNWPPQVACATSQCKEAREWVSSAVTVLVLLGGLFQYWRAQQWKRAEFVAAEMKAFFSDRDVRKVVTMIDWTQRHINLFNDINTNPRAWPLVSRQMQTRALYLHTLAKDVIAFDEKTSSEAPGSDLAGFTHEQAAIRDAYDAFLDGLERFSSYVTTGLVSVRDLRPYLKYWMYEIPKKGDDDENEWSCIFFAYVAFYDYTGVQRLFSAFGRDIAFGSPLFEDFLSTMRDKSLAERLRAELNTKAASSEMESLAR